MEGEDQAILVCIGLEALHGAAGSSKTSQAGDEARFSFYGTAPVCYCNRALDGWILVQSFHHICLEGKNLPPNSEEMEQVWQAAQKRFIHELQRNDILILVPNTAQVFGQSHERIEECGFVFRMVSGVVDAWNTILNLRRRYQCTPSIIRVVGSHAGIANVHKGRITLSATHGIGKPGFRIFAVCRDAHIKAFGQAVW